MLSTIMTFTYQYKDFMHTYLHIVERSEHSYVTISFPLTFKYQCTHYNDIQLSIYMNKILCVQYFIM